VRGIFSDSVIIGTTNVAVASVTQIERRQHIGGGGTPGALLGGALVGMLGLVIVNGLCESNCSFKGLCWRVRRRRYDRRYYRRPTWWYNETEPDRLDNHMASKLAT
jgi:hypothetical protein